jgi:hypothetical protein
MLALQAFRARANSDAPSSFRMAKMRLIGQMLEMREYDRLVPALVRSPTDLDYYKALLHGSDFPMNTGGRIFDRIREVLLMAYENGADLSSLLPMFKKWLSRENPRQIFSRELASICFLGSFVAALNDGKPSKKEAAEALLEAAVSFHNAPIIYARKRLERERLVGEIVHILKSAAEHEFEMPEEMNNAILSLTR